MLQSGNEDILPISSAALCNMLLDFSPTKEVIRLHHHHHHYHHHYHHHQYHRHHHYTNHYFHQLFICK